MKKVLSLFMVLLLAISLFACENKENKEPTVPIPATPEQVTPITPTETPVIPPETPVTPSETPVIPPETPTPDVPDTPIRNPEEVLEELLIAAHDNFEVDWYFLFKDVPFLSVEDAEAVMEGEKEADGWHVMNTGGDFAVKIYSDTLPSYPSNYETVTFNEKLYLRVPLSEYSSPQPDSYFRVLEDGRILEYYLLDYLHSDIERYVIYDTVEQIFGS